MATVTIVNPVLTLTTSSYFTVTPLSSWSTTATELTLAPDSPFLDLTTTAVAQAQPAFLYLTTTAAIIPDVSGLWAGPPGLSPSASPWQCFVYETMTGDITAVLPLAMTPEYEYGINMQGSITVTVPLGGNGMDRDEFDRAVVPWVYSLAIVRDNVVLEAGPITSDNYTDSTAAQAPVTAAGMWGMFTQRVLINPSFPVGSAPNVAAADTTYNNMSLRQIAKRIVQDNLSRSAKYRLPIDFPADDPADINTRTYAGVDLNLISDMLTNLTEVDSGPEIRFQPYMKSPTQISHRMNIGNPQIGQLGSAWFYDVGNIGACMYLDYARSGTSQITTSYVKGSTSDDTGDGADTSTDTDTQTTLMSVYVDTDSATSKFPALEGVDTNHTDVVIQATADSYAKANVNTYHYPLVTFTATVRLDGRDIQGLQTASPTLADIAAGDLATFHVENHRRIPDGNYTMRILSIKNQDDGTAVLTLQPTSYL